MKKRALIFWLMLIAATVRADTVTIEIECLGKFVVVDEGYHCLDAPPPGTIGDVEIILAPHLNAIVTRRKTDSSNAVRIEVPKSAKVRVNGVMQP